MRTLDSSKAFDKVNLHVLVISIIRNSYVHELYVY